MSNLAHDFKNFARYFPSMPIRWTALHYAKRHLKSHRRIPPEMAVMLAYMMWADKKYSDSQPRIPAGSPGGGQWTSGDGGGSTIADSLNGQNPFSMADVAYICTLSGKSVFTDKYGNFSWTATYDCFGGQEIRIGGIGAEVPGFIPDPYFGVPVE
jgi:hypothetical protein